MEIERYDPEKHGTPIGKGNFGPTKEIDAFWEIAKDGGAVVPGDNFKTTHARLRGQAKQRRLRMGMKRLPDGRYLVTAVPE